MKRKISACLLSLLGASITLNLTANSIADEVKGNEWLYTQTSKSKKSMTADKSLQLLKEGNARFVRGQYKSRDYLKQARLTGTKGQYPFAIILSCMDSRDAPDLIFDQGIGDIFSERLAGNVLDQDQLGGLEYATKLAGSHLIVVMGHTHCGAVTDSCIGLQLGNLTQQLKKIQPAIEQVKKANKTAKLDCNNQKIIDEIARQNVLDVVQEVKSQSLVINELVNSGQVKIVGAMHDLQTGKVTFIE